VNSDRRPLSDDGQEIPPRVRRRRVSAAGERFVLPAQVAEILEPLDEHEDGRTGVAMSRWFLCRAAGTLPSKTICGWGGVNFRA
jgi:hypothetical protein